jgi:hypothetical protein
MTTTQAHDSNDFHPTLAMAQDRARVLHLEAHHERLAAQGHAGDRPSIRVRVGQALIDLGSSLVTPAGTRQPSLTD